MQVYRELKILTSRPSCCDELEAPHRLYGFISVAEKFSVGRWLKHAISEINQTLARGRLPIVVGGSGLYLKAIKEGISKIPEIPSNFRQKVLLLHKNWGSSQFHRELSKLDPISAKKIRVSDTQRLIRAYEVALSTGRPISDWHKDKLDIPLKGVSFINLYISPPRKQLYRSINKRFEHMLDNGVLTEVDSIMKMNLPKVCPAMKALGLPELIAYKTGDMALNQSVSMAQQTSRNYAKRQLTWFRNQFEPNFTLNEQYSERNKEKIFSIICKNLLTPSI